MKQTGFSLIELSIVLVIIALLISAVISAVGVVRGAEVRSIISEVEDIQRNIGGFYNRYNGLPGDIENAATYFGTTACNSANAAEMNGDGDGRIEFVDDTDGVVESYKAWCHLTLTTLITDEIDGAKEDTITAPLIKLDIPQSNRVGMGYILAHDIVITDKNEIIFGMPVNGTYADNAISMNGSMTVDEALALDAKIDDGKASSGKVQAFEGDDAVVNSCLQAGNYNGGVSSDKNCGISFELGM